MSPTITLGRPEVSTRLRAPAICCRRVACVTFHGRSIGFSRWISMTSMGPLSSCHAVGSSRQPIRPSGELEALDIDRTFRRDTEAHEVLPRIEMAMRV